MLRAPQAYSTNSGRMWCRGLHDATDTHSNHLNNARPFPQAYITNFGEEVVRGQPLFVLSVLLRWLAPMLRESAGVSSWQVMHRSNTTIVYAAAVAGANAAGVCQRVRREALGLSWPD